MYARHKQLFADAAEQLGAQHCDGRGNPIRAGNGNKFQTETDYLGVGPAPLEFKRFYNSRSAEENGDMGAMWRHSYSQHVIQVNATTATVTREDGADYTFTLQGGEWKTSAYITGRLSQSQNGWQFITGNDVTEVFDSSGRLTSIVTRSGLTTTLGYAADGLASVTNPFGKSLTFTYVGGRIDTMTDPAGGTYRYGYSDDRYFMGTTNLTSVAYPDSNVRNYTYGVQFGDVGLPNALTAITDENGAKFAQWAYEQSGRAIASWHGNGADLVAFQFDQPGGATVVTDAAGNQNTYHFTQLFGVTRPTQVDGASCVSCGGVTQNTAYDANGFVESRTDHNGNMTKYINNARGLVERKTEAYGTAEQRTVNTVWHANFRVPVCREEPMRTTLLDYDASGSLTQRIEIDTVDSAHFPDAASKSCASVQANRVSQLASWNTRISSFGYYTSGSRKGLLQAANGPLPPDANGVDDITTYVHDSSTGNLTEIQRPYSQTTRITAHDAHGRPTTVVDPNGLTTRLTYTARGWLDKVEVGSDAAGYEATDYSYDKVGNLTGVTLPSGDTLTYTYDTAHRLTDIRGSAGEHIHYTLDAMGNRTETTTDVSGTLKRKHAQVFNLANRLESIKNAAGAIVQSYTYDDNGNALTSTDADNSTTTNTYDALDRVKTVIDALGGLTQYGYDAGGHLTSVTDPKASASGTPYATTYVYDGFDNLKTQTNPDTGVTNFVYDAAGRVTTKTDARGITTQYSYDALGRLTRITYPSEAPTTYTYDSCANGVGRLCQVTDPSGSTQWTYDLHGRVTSKTQTSGSPTLVTRYSYDAVTGNLTSMTLPSGTTVTYSYASGKVTALNSNRGLIMNAMTYDPFGPLKSWTFGNGQVMQRNYNLDGQLDTYIRGSASVDLNYNLTGTVKEQLDLSNAANNQSYGYDALQRLTSYIPSPASGGGPGWGWSYDPNGNRESAVQDVTTKDYIIDPTSNLLKGIDALTFTYDAVGNTLNDGSHSYQYDERNRLSKIDAGTPNELRYVMNALGQRVAKLGTQPAQPGDTNGDGRITRDDVYTLNNQLLQRNTAAGNPDCTQDGSINTKDTLCINTKSQSNSTNAASAKTYFAYDEAGHLIGEYDANGNAIQETVWFQDQPVATIKGKTLYFIHTDHLNTPRAIADKNKKTLWTWNSEPFGATPANEDADADGEKFVYNLRFPGQVYDQESNLHYNYFRTYNPSTGRYTQSDPIGLAGGLDSFGYVGSNPLGFSDPSGLVKIVRLPGFDDLNAVDKALTVQRENILESQAQRLRNQIERTTAICNASVRKKYLDLVDDWTISVRVQIRPGEDPAASSYANKSTVFNNSAFARPVIDGRSAPDAVFYMAMRNLMAHELRHLTPYNHGLPSNGLGGYLTGHQGEREKDANNFSDDLMSYQPDKGCICNF